MTRDLNQLAKEIYEANKAKGFHEEKQSYEHMTCLVISELMEAVEADRKGRKADFENFNKQYEYSFKDNFEEYIKDTVEDELADAAIRLLDTAGALGLAMCTYRRAHPMIKNRFENRLFTESVIKNRFENTLFTESMIVVIRGLLNSPLSLDVVIPGIISYIETLCEVMEIDLWKHVELKLKYNSLRPYKHGKAY